MVAGCRAAAAKLLVSLAVFCCASAAPGSIESTASPTVSSTAASTPTSIVTTTTATTKPVTTATSSGPITTAPVFLPYYDQAAWSALRGSILSSDEVKNCTAYTIFCRKEPDHACNLALDFPFIFVEGPRTVEFHGTYTSTFIANIECELDERTAATCSGYSSYKSGYKNGPITGPTEISWTSTLSGTDVAWGVLTMADIPKPTDSDNDGVIDVTRAPTKNTALLFLPSDTPENAASTQAVQVWTAVIAAASTIFAGLLL